MTTHFVFGYQIICISYKNLTATESYLLTALLGVCILSLVYQTLSYISDFSCALMRLFKKKIQGFEIIFFHRWVIQVSTPKIKDNKALPTHFAIVDDVSDTTVEWLAMRHILPPIEGRIDFTSVATT